MSATGNTDRGLAALMHEVAMGDADLREQTWRQLAVLPVVADATVSATEMAVRLLQNDDTPTENVLGAIRSFDTWIGCALRQVELVTNTLRIARYWAEREYAPLAGVPLSCDRTPDPADVEGLQPEGLPS